MAVLTVCQQLEDDLRHDILSGKFPGRSRLPSESVLAARYSICRSTVRKALDRLERDGLLYRVKGSGTFAVPAPERHLTYPKRFRGHRRKCVLFLSFSTSYSEATFRENLNFRKLFDEMSCVLDSGGCSLMWCHVGLDFKPPQCLIDRGIDGILFHGRVPLDFWSRYMKGIPCVAINQFCPELNCSCVRSDPQMRAWLAISHLKDLGHTRIGYICDGIGSYPQKERYDAFLNMLDFLRLPHRSRWDAVWQRPRVNGELLIEKGCPDFTPQLEPVMALAESPTAFVCLDSSRAFFAKSALEKLGYSVPLDISLVGARMLSDSYVIGHKIFPHHCDSFYTALVEHSEQIYCQSVRLLLDQIFSPEQHPVLNQLVVPELDVKKSTAPVRAGSSGKVKHLETVLTKKRS